MSILVELWETIQEWDNLSDVRTKGNLLVDTIWPILSIIAAYNFLIWKGVKFMKNRQPYKLRYLSLIYNFFTIFINAYIVVENVRCAFIGLRYNFFCNKNTWNNTDPLELEIIKTNNIAYMSKILELLDTAFIVLAKREKNLSLLHIYHHNTVVFNAWILAKWFPTGESVVAYTINAVVHVIMYTYYALSSLGPKIAKYLWWKKYLTILQLVQFFYGVILIGYWITKDCPFFPYWYKVYSFFYIMSFLVLFAQFYFQTYSIKKQKVL